MKRSQESTPRAFRHNEWPADQRTIIRSAPPSLPGLPFRYHHNRSRVFHATPFSLLQNLRPCGCLQLSYRKSVTTTSRTQRHMQCEACDAHDTCEEPLGSTACGCTYRNLPEKAKIQHDGGQPHPLFAGERVGSPRSNTDEAWTRSIVSLDHLMSGHPFRIQSVFRLWLLKPLREQHQNANICGRPGGMEHFDCQRAASGRARRHERTSAYWPAQFLR